MRESVCKEEGLAHRAGGFGLQLVSSMPLGPCVKVSWQRHVWNKTCLPHG